MKNSKRKNRSMRKLMVWFVKMFVLAIITIVIAKSTIPSLAQFIKLTDNRNYISSVIDKLGHSTPELDRAYQKALADIEDFSKKSQFNHFLVYSGGSSANKAIRFAVIVFLVSILVFNIALFIRSLSDNYEYVRKILRCK